MAKERVHDPDDELVRECRQGNRQAFNKLILRYQKVVYALAYRLLGNREDAEEIGQEVFLRAWRYLRQFRGQASFFTWLYRIALNLCINQLNYQKSRGKELPFEEQYTPPEPSSSPLERVASKEIQTIVQKGINTLSPDSRAVVVLRFNRGFSYEEIADLLGVKIETVKSRLHQDRTLLKEWLKSYIF